MITTGPYTPAAATTFTVNDPANHTASSVAVQVQNYSGFSLSIQCRGFNFTVPAYFAATIPTGGQGQPVTITPSSTIANQTGSLSLVWLLASDVAPIPDGSLSANLATSRTQAVTWAGSGSPYTTTINLLATDQAVAIPLGTAGAGSTGSISIKGNQSGVTYGAFSYNTYGNAGALSGPYPVSGAIDTSVTVTVYRSAGSAPSSPVVIYSGSALSVAQVVNLPGQSLDVVPYGGLLQVALSTTNTGGNFAISAPAAGYALRLHRAVVDCANTTAANSRFRLLQSDVASVPLSVMVWPYKMADNMDGVLTTGAVWVAADIAANVDWVINYDLVAIPQVN